MDWDKPQLADNRIFALTDVDRRQTAGFQCPVCAQKETDDSVAIRPPSFSVPQCLIKRVHYQKPPSQAGMRIKSGLSLKLGLRALHTPGVAQSFLLLGSDVH